MNPYAPPQTPPASSSPTFSGAFFECLMLGLKTAAAAIGGFLAVCWASTLWNWTPGCLKDYRAIAVVTKVGIDRLKPHLLDSGVEHLALFPHTTLSLRPSICEQPELLRELRDEAANHSGWLVVRVAGTANCSGSGWVPALQGKALALRKVETWIPDSYRRLEACPLLP